VNTTITADTITRIAFGSCAKQSKSMPVLLAAKEAKPDVFIWLGDNIYGDTDDMAVMRAKYAELSCRPEFKSVERQRALPRHVGRPRLWSGRYGEGIPFQSGVKGGVHAVLE
jgi:hypothetical protein